MPHNQQKPNSSDKKSSRVHFKNRGKIVKSAPKIIESKAKSSKVKCTKCSNTLVNLKITRSKICVACLKKESIVTNKLKSANSLQSASKRASRSTTKNITLNNSTKISLQINLRNPSLRNATRPKTNEINVNDQPKTKNAEPISTSNSVKLRINKRSYTQLACGNIEDEKESKKRKIARPNHIEPPNLRGSRNQRQTVKGSEKLNTVNSRQQINHRKDSLPIRKTAPNLKKGVNTKTKVNTSNKQISKKKVQISNTPSKSNQKTNKVSSVTPRSSLKRPIKTREANGTQSTSAKNQKITAKTLRNSKSKKVEATSSQTTLPKRREKRTVGRSIDKNATKCISEKQSTDLPINLEESSIETVDSKVCQYENKESTFDIQKCTSILTEASVNLTVAIGNEVKSEGSCESSDSGNPLSNDTKNKPSLPSDVNKTHSVLEDSNDNRDPVNIVSENDVLLNDKANNSETNEDIKSCLENSLIKDTEICRDTKPSENVSINVDVICNPKRMEAHRSTITELQLRPSTNKTITNSVCGLSTDIKVPSGIVTEVVDLPSDEMTKSVCIQNIEMKAHKSSSTTPVGVVQSINTNSTRGEFNPNRVAEVNVHTDSNTAFCTLREDVSTNIINNSIGNIADMVATDNARQTSINIKDCSRSGTEGDVLPAGIKVNDSECQKSICLKVLSNNDRVAAEGTRESNTNKQYNSNTVTEAYNSFVAENKDADKVCKFDIKDDSNSETGTDIVLLPKSKAVDSVYEPKNDINNESSDGTKIVVILTAKNESNDRACDLTDDIKDNSSISAIKVDDIQPKAGNKSYNGARELADYLQDHSSKGTKVGDIISAGEKQCFEGEKDQSKIINDHSDEVTKGDVVMAAEHKGVDVGCVAITSIKDHSSSKSEVDITLTDENKIIGGPGLCESINYNKDNSSSKTDVNNPLMNENKITDRVGPCELNTEIKVNSSCKINVGTDGNKFIDPLSGTEINSYIKDDSNKGTKTDDIISADEKTRFEGEHEQSCVINDHSNEVTKIDVVMAAENKDVEAGCVTFKDNSSKKSEVDITLTIENKITECLGLGGSKIENKDNSSSKIDIVNTFTGENKATDCIGPCESNNKIAVNLSSTINVDNKLTYDNNIADSLSSHEISSHIRDVSSKGTKVVDIMLSGDPHFFEGEHDETNVISDHSDEGTKVHVVMAAEIKDVEVGCVSITSVKDNSSSKTEVDIILTSENKGTYRVGPCESSTDIKVNLSNKIHVDKNLTGEINVADSLSSTEVNSNIKDDVTKGIKIDDISVDNQKSLGGEGEQTDVIKDHHSSDEETKVNFVMSAENKDFDYKNIDCVGLCELSNENKDNSKSKTDDDNTLSDENKITDCVGPCESSMEIKVSSSSEINVGNKLTHENYVADSVTSNDIKDNSKGNIYVDNMFTDECKVVDSVSNNDIKDNPCSEIDVNITLTNETNVADSLSSSKIKDSSVSIINVHGKLTDENNFADSLSSTELNSNIKDYPSKGTKVEDIISAGGKKSFDGEECEQTHDIKDNLYEGTKVDVVTATKNNDVEGENKNTDCLGLCVSSNENKHNSNGTSDGDALTDENKVTDCIGPCETSMEIKVNSSSKINVSNKSATDIKDNSSSNIYVDNMFTDESKVVDSVSNNDIKDNLCSEIDVDITLTKESNIANSVSSTKLEDTSVSKFNVHNKVTDEEKISDSLTGTEINFNIKDTLSKGSKVEDIISTGEKKSFDEEHDQLNDIKDQSDEGTKVDVVTVIKNKDVDVRCEASPSTKDHSSSIAEVDVTLTDESNIAACIGLCESGYENEGNSCSKIDVGNKLLGESNVADSVSSTDIKDNSGSKINVDNLLTDKITVFDSVSSTEIKDISSGNTIDNMLTDENKVADSVLFTDTKDNLNSNIYIYYTLTDENNKVADSVSSTDIKDNSSSKIDVDNLLTNEITITDSVLTTEIKDNSSSIIDVDNTLTDETNVSDSISSTETKVNSCSKIDVANILTDESKDVENCSRPTANIQLLSKSSPLKVISDNLTSDSKPDHNQATNIILSDERFILSNLGTLEKATISNRTPNSLQEINETDKLRSLNLIDEQLLNDKDNKHVYRTEDILENYTNCDNALMFHNVHNNTSADELNTGLTQQEEITILNEYSRFGGIKSTGTEVTFNQQSVQPMCEDTDFKGEIMSVENDDLESMQCSSGSRSSNRMSIDEDNSEMCVDSDVAFQSKEDSEMSMEVN